jgi:hypothetical protein
MYENNICDFKHDMSFFNVNINRKNIMKLYLPNAWGCDTAILLFLKRGWNLRSHHSPVPLSAAICGPFIVIKKT